jgi:hypothetical protein
MSPGAAGGPLPGTGIRDRVHDLPDALLDTTEERWGWRFHRHMGRPLLLPSQEPAPSRFPAPHWARSARLGSRREAADGWRQWARACRAMLADYQRRRREVISAKAAIEDMRPSRFTVARLAVPGLRGPVDSAVLWTALSPMSSRRVDVYGGVGDGWCSLLVTFGSSLLARGYRLVVLDVSAQRVADPLLGFVELVGKSVHRWLLPDEGPQLDLFQGRTAHDVAEALADAVSTGPDGGDRERDLDAYLLQRVCAVIAPDLTGSRICAGLRALTGEEQRGDTRSPLTPDEFDNLAESFGEVGRRQHDARMSTLLSRLQQVSTWGSQDRRPLLAAGHDLSVIELEKGTRPGRARTLGPLLLQALVHPLEQPAGVRNGRPTAVILAGADWLPADQLEWLDGVARAAGIRLAYLFQHLRGEAERLLGGGPVILMRMGNAAEAEAACKFIGREHRFVMHQFTKTAGTGKTTSTTFTEANSSQRSKSVPEYGPDSVTVGTSMTRSRGETEGSSTSDSEATATQRVYDLRVEPDELQTLAETAFFFVDPDDKRRPRARLGDCNPWLVTSPGVENVPWRSIIPAIRFAMYGVPMDAAS